MVIINIIMKNKEIVDSVRGNSIMLLVLEDFKILPDKAHQNALSKPVRVSIDSIKKFLVSNGNYNQ